VLTEQYVADLRDEKRPITRLFRRKSAKVFGMLEAEVFNLSR
jgi:hypothetical protein